MKVNLKDYIAQRKKELRNSKYQQFRHPRLLILQMGDDPASNSYIKGKLKDAKECGVVTTLFKSDNFTLMHEFLQNMGKRYEGIILQEPHNLDKTDYEKIMSHISKWQDVDGFKADSMHTPCTPKGILSILRNFYCEEPAGKVAVVVGKGRLVGGPLVPLLMKEGFTVISCNSKTDDLQKMVKLGDVVVSAVGKENLITRDMLKDGAFVVDAGITFDEDGKICGDCDKALYDDEDVLVTPVPGGVGLMTRLSLMENVIEME